ncbi:hypothetical protein [Brevibacillus choshinensis]|uniref:Antitoxin VbhA domain-containing protein n=1 Tax=Brevibacillus choshinensis TaxID=54911 RepID=A0ABX7FR07_BRECH|nr:hypothetical protein [Brevibacillus choshinensis]QRG68597.1 hypothetical protein JNE38_05445 [Brevibacillus choshinensis]
MARKDPQVDPADLKRTRRDWIESAAYLKAERFEVAGALFDCKENELVAESEVKKRLANYKGGV